MPARALGIVICHCNSRRRRQTWPNAPPGRTQGDSRFAGAALDKGADIDAKCSEGNSALCVAARRGHEEMVRLLAGRGADLELRNTRGWISPLCVCC